MCGMSGEEPRDETEDSDEERIFLILDENPFYDDRLETLLNCVTIEVGDQGLPDDKCLELYQELRGIVDKYELMLPKKEDVN
jgi:hypothetical protein